jgi:asparaginyl-tRNA synthetase
MQTFIKDLATKVGEEVTIKGWLYNSRFSGKIGFLEIRDGSGWIQAVASQDEVGESVWEEIKNSGQEASVEIVGKVVEHPKKKGVFELQAKSYKLIANSSDYPIAHKEHGPDFLLDNRHLWIRTPTQWAVLHMRHLVKAGLQDYFNSNGFVELDTPTFTPNACEGTTDLFKVDYFGEPAYLSQNGQLYLEALSSAFGKVYDLCPNFRAEKSKTRKHLIEFWTLNPEMAFIEHEESLQIQEAAIKHLVKYVLEHGQAELKILERSIDDLKSIVEKPFKHYLYSEAIEELQKRGSAIKYGDDLGAEDEVLLTENSDVPVVVKNWPKTIKPFYMKADPTN